MTALEPSNSMNCMVQSWTDVAVSSASRRVQEDSADADRREQHPIRFILETMTLLNRSSDPSEGCRVLANRLQQFLCCRLVVVGTRVGQATRCRVGGISGAAHFDIHAGLTRLIRNAMAETVAGGKGTVCVSGEVNDKHSIQAHQELVSELKAERVTGEHLRDGEGRTIGVVLLIDDSTESGHRLLAEYGECLSSCLMLLRQNRRNAVKRFLGRLRSRFDLRRGVISACGVAVLASLLAVPWPHQIACKCKVQPMKRRFVVAPYDGTLAASLVVPGDVVQQGDVLARMDEQEIQWEVAKVKADLARARKERDAAMAGHRTSDAQLARLEMDRLELEIQLLESRIDHLAIKSPIDGVVVIGDLQKAEGAPLTIGQSLFEIAPLDRMVVEVGVPEEEISRVQPGMEVMVSLDALPNREFTQPLGLIHPQAELRDHSSVFVTELEIDNVDGLLRPGMNGQARVTSRCRSIGWILFHKPCSRIRRWFAW